MKKIDLTVVLAILNNKWNPIGLSLSDDDDEYKDYAQHIVEKSPWQAEALADYLIYIENKHMCLPVDRARKNVAQTVAKEIVGFSHGG